MNQYEKPHRRRPHDVDPGGLQGVSPEQVPATLRMFGHTCQFRHLPLVDAVRGQSGACACDEDRLGNVYDGAVSLSTLWHYQMACIASLLQ